MIYSATAIAQIDGLLRHYRSLGRVEAIRNLLASLEQAEDRIQRGPAKGLAAPRPYLGLAQPGRAWIKAGRYWIKYGTGDEAVIFGVFYETADLPNRD